MTAAKRCDRITDSLGRVEAGASQARQASDVMTEILGSVNKVSDLMGEIAAASEEQSAGIEQVNRAIRRCSRTRRSSSRLRRPRLRWTNKPLT